MKKKYMTKKKGFYSPVDRLVRVAALVLVAVSLFGIFRLYGNAQKAADSLTLPERASLSSKIDMQTDDFDNNVVEKTARSLYGTLASDGGEVLVDLTHSNTNTPALGSLLGTLNAIDVSDTRYFLNNYKAAIFPAVTWNALNGFNSPDGTVTLTIDSRAQNSIYQKMVDLGIYGAVVLYNYNTGEVKALCSTPGLGEKNEAGEAVEGSFLNKCWFRTSPGSTMKIVTLFVAVAQGIDVANTVFRCEGGYRLADGTTVRCTGWHGSLDGITAVGRSCNCYFAQLAGMLDIAKTCEILQDIGFSMNGEGPNTFYVGNIPVDTSIATFTDHNFVSTWNMIGQTSVLISPLQIAVLAGNYATGGQPVLPRLTTSEPVVKSSYGAMYAKALEKAWAVWKAGYEQCYAKRDYGQRVVAAKTGTSDKLGDNKETHKLLLAVIDDYAVYIVIENYLQSRVMPYKLLPTIEEAISTIGSEEVLQ